MSPLSSCPMAMLSCSLSSHGAAWVDAAAHHARHTLVCCLDKHCFLLAMAIKILRRHACNLFCV